MQGANEKDLRTAVLTLRRALENLLYVVKDYSATPFDDEIREAQQAVEYATDVLDPTLSRVISR